MCSILTKLFAAVFFVVSILHITLAAVASDCVARPRVVVRSHHVAPVVVHHGRAVVSGYGYGHHALDHHVDRVHIEPLEVQRDYYYSVQGYYRDKLLVDAFAGRALEMYRMGLFKDSGIPGVAPIMPPAASVPPVPAPKLGKTPDKARAVLEARCVKCHSTDSPGGGLDLSNPDSVSDAMRWKSWGMSSSGDMPKGGSPIADAEVEALMDWARAAIVVRK